MKKLLFISALWLLAMACSDDEKKDDFFPELPPEEDEVVIPTAPKVQNVGFADITDASALYITSGTVATKAGSDDEEKTEQNTLFKITANNQVEEVQFSSEEKDSIDQPKIFFIKDLSERYIYMSYDNVVKYDTIEYWGWNETTHKDTVSYEFQPCWEHTQVLVKKDDGAVFKIESETTWGKSTYENYKSYDLINEYAELQVDYNGYVYCFYKGYDKNFGDWGSIIKIYTHGKEVYLTQINRDDMKAQWTGSGYFWLVDQQGNVIINKDFTRLASGEFTRSPEMREWLYNNVFTAYSDSEGFYQFIITHEEVEDDRYSNGYGVIDKYWIQYCQAEAPAMSWKNQVEVLKGDIIHGSIDNDYRVFSFKDKTIVIIEGWVKKENWTKAIYADIKLTIYDRNRVEEEILEDKNLSDEDYKYYGNTLPCTEKYLYKVTDQQIWRADIETGKAELLYDYGKEYMIKSIKVKNNIVTCDAFELRKGNDVVMEIYEDKTVHHVESTNNDKIIYLERLQ